MVRSGRQAYLEGARAGIMRSPPYWIDEWADENRELTGVGSAEAGRWRTSRVPFAREIMRCLSPQDPCTIVTFMKPPQIVGTEIVLNFIFSGVDKAPGPAVIVQPNRDLAKIFSKQRVAPAIEAMPCLSSKIKPSRSRDSGNSTYYKEYPGGMILMIGANSNALFRQVAARYLVVDDIDECCLSANIQGDVWELVLKRSITFGKRKKAFGVSTPTVKGRSKSEDLFLESDQRHYHVPCPECGEKQRLRWKHESGAYGLIFAYDDDYNLTSDVTYCCVHCGSMIHESCKTKMLNGGVWIAENSEKGKHPGFHLNALYSPLGWVSWKEIVEKFLECKRTNDLKKWIVFTNHYLVETWEERGQGIKHHPLYGRREKMGAQIDSRILVITAFVDVQGDRVEVTVIGWGLIEEGFVLEHQVFYGELTEEIVWGNLDLFLAKTYLHEYGMMRISIVGVDAGYMSNRVYEFTKPLENKRVYATKGSSIDGHPFCKKPTRNNKGVLLFQLGVSEIKLELYARLGLKTPGARYLHFSDTLEEEWFKQLTAEHCVGGKWKKKRERNEAGDCVVGNIGVLYILRAMVYPLFTVDQMLERLLSNREIRAAEDAKPVPVASAVSGDEGDRDVDYYGA